MRRRYLDGDLWGPDDSDDSKKEKNVFFTNREGWSKTLDAPQIQGFRKGNKLRIEISANGRSESQYNNAVIPRYGIHTISIGERGDIILYGWHGVGKLTPIQKNVLLVGIFAELKGGAIGELERCKKTLSEIQSTS